MAVRGSRVTVGTTPVAILHVTGKGSGAVVKNIGGASIDLGGPNVTSGNGFPLPADQSVAVEFGKEETLWAVTASGTVTVALLEGGV